jgi:ubiquitin-protein ligase
MPNSEKRLLEDWGMLQEMSQRSGFWRVSRPAPTAADGWMVEVQIEGKSLRPPEHEQSSAHLGQPQRIRVEVDRQFPQSPPWLQMESPVFHPNLPKDGRVTPQDLQVRWQPQVRLDLLLERLWEILRGKRVDLAHAVHPAARQWYKKQLKSGQLDLPFDARPLTRTGISSRNVVRYRRRGESFREPAPAETLLIDDAGTSADPESPHNPPVHFID